MLRSLERHRRGILLLYFAMLLALTLTPISLGSGQVGSLDKIAHAVLFAMLAVLLYWNFAGLRRAAATIQAVLLSTACAGLIEWLQMRVPRREGDFADFIAGVLGAIVAAIAAAAWSARRTREGRESPAYGQSEEAGSP